MLADRLDMAIVPEICQWSELLTEEAVFFLLFNKELSPQVLTLQGLQGPCFNPWDAPVSPMFAPVTPWMCIPLHSYCTKWPITHFYSFSGSVSHPKLAQKHGRHVRCVVLPRPAWTRSELGP